MKILAFDCSGKTLSAAVGDDKVEAEAFVEENRNHAPYLLPTIEKVLKEANWQPKDLEQIAVTVGPGSFTGLRIGLATAKGLGDTLGIPLVGVNTMDALARQMAHRESIIVPLLDARKNQVYTAIYDNRQGNVEQIHPYTALSPVEELVELLRPYDEILFLGDGVEIWKEQLIAVYQKRATLAQGQDNGVHARHIITLAKGKEGSADLAPFYLRGVDAKAKFK